MELEYDVIQFIKEVEKRPILWAKSYPGYSYSLEKQARIEIARALFESFGLTEKELNQASQVLSVKWRRLASRYRNRSKQTKKGKEYKYSEHLEFLDEKQESIYEKKKYGLQTTSLKLSIEDKPIIEKEKTYSYTMAAKYNVSSLKLASHPDNSLLDIDKMFLLSLIPDLKSIPEELRLHVKMKMMQVMQNAMYDRRTNPI